MSFNLNLFGKNVVPYILSCFSNVGSLSEISNESVPYPSHHAFEGDDSNCEVIDSYSMVLTAHNFRCHVARSSAGFLRVVRIPYSCYAEVGNSEVTLVVEDQIFGFDIPVEYAFIMDVF